MAQRQSESISYIREYATVSRDMSNGQMDLDASDTEARLDQTVKELQESVQEQQAALERVRQRGDNIDENPLTVFY